jgi:hypothetical protein
MADNSDDIGIAQKNPLLIQNSSYFKSSCRRMGSFQRVIYQKRVRSQYQFELMSCFVAESELRQIKTGLQLFRYD